jgi:hypothetical protein
MSKSEDSDHEFEMASAGGGAYVISTMPICMWPCCGCAHRSVVHMGHIYVVYVRWVIVRPYGSAYCMYCNLTFTRLLKFMKNKEYKLLPAQLLDNKDEQQLFQSSVSTVHATDFFDLLKTAIPPKAVILTNKTSHFGTENGKMVVAEHGRGCVINRIALMAIVVAHPDGQVIALEYNQPILNRPTIICGDGIATKHLKTVSLNFLNL